MRRSWVLPMPVLPANPWVDPDGRWCEALVLGVFWLTGPGTPVHKILVAIPEAAGDGGDTAVEIVTNLYLPATGPEAGEPVEEAVVRVVVLPGDFLVKRLAEGVPREEQLIAFSEAFPSALPIGGQVYPVLPELEEFQKGVMVCLIEEEQGQEDLCVTYGQENLLEETYHSTGEGEMAFTDLQEALLPVSAAATTRRRSAASTEKAESLFSGVPGGRKGARVLSAAPEVSPMASAKPKMGARRESPQARAQPDVNEIMAVLGALTEKVNSLSEQRITSAQGPIGARGASLLDPGRVPAPGVAGVAGIARAGLGARGETAGNTAYERTLAAARQLVGDATVGPTTQEARGIARGRSGEDALREQISKGGAEGLQATQLAILEALERLQDGQKGRGATRHDALEDILAGLGSGSGETSLLGEDDAEGGRSSGSKGLGGMTRLQAALARHPDKCSLMADQRAWRLLGSDVSNTPWSMALYGQQQLKFGKLESHQRMWDMLSSFHALARQQEWSQLGMRITQCLKAVEQSVQHGGSWRVAWLHTGLPDSRGNVMGNTGLAHPTELALAVQVLKDQKALEDALKRAGTGGGTPEGLPGPEPRKGRKGKGEGKAPSGPAEQA
eukprot:6159247-Amphidinium_carterae.5